MLATFRGWGNCARLSGKRRLAGRSTKPAGESLLSRRGGRPELCLIERDVTVDVRRDLGALGNDDVFAVNQQKQWRSREKYNTGRYHGPGDRPLMAAALHILNRAQSYLFAGNQLHIVDVNVELAA